MNIRTLARVIGGFVVLLGIVGLMSGETQLFNMMNTDIMLDVTRIALGGILFAGSYMGDKTLKGAYALFGIVYLGNFLMALISPTMFGMLPNMFGLMDNALHLIGGLLALSIAFLPVGSSKVGHAA